MHRLSLNVNKLTKTRWDKALSYPWPIGWKWRLVCVRFVRLVAILRSHRLLLGWLLLPVHSVQEDSREHEDGTEPLENICITENMSSCLQKVPGELEERCQTWWRWPAPWRTSSWWWRWSRAGGRTRSHTWRWRTGIVNINLMRKDRYQVNKPVRERSWRRRMRAARRWRGVSGWRRRTAAPRRWRPGPAPGSRRSTCSWRASCGRTWWRAPASSAPGTRTYINHQHIMFGSNHVSLLVSQWDFHCARKCFLWSLQTKVPISCLLMIC